MKDQAEQLRSRITANVKKGRNARIITVTSGKGGVGKSSFTVNFALSLIQMQKKVLIFDVDIGLANVDVLLGHSPKKNLIQMIEENLSIWDVMEEHSSGLLYVAGGSGLNHLRQMNEQKLLKLFKELYSLQHKVDFIILDTGAGLTYDIIRYMLAADDIMLMTTPEPTSITDAYALLKTIHQLDESKRVNIIVNRVSAYQECIQTISRLQRVANKFLNMNIHSFGGIPEDPYVIKAVKNQTPFYTEYPLSSASKAINRITHEFLHVPIPMYSGIKGFLRKLFGA